MILGSLVLPMIDVFRWVVKTWKTSNTPKFFDRFVPIYDNFCNDVEILAKLSYYITDRTDILRAKAEGENWMTAKQELISYISTLTPEQAEKVVSQLPRLSESLAKSSQPCHQEQIAQIA